LPEAVEPTIVTTFGKVFTICQLLDLFFEIRRKKIYASKDSEEYFSLFLEYGTDY